MKRKWYASKQVLFSVIGAFLLSVMTGYFAIDKLLLSTPEVESYKTEDGTEVKRINVLLLGVDARPGETKSRTDTMIVASIDPETQSVTMISIPRDTRVEIPGKGNRKINSAAIYGGVELAEKVVENLLGIPIHYHVMTNFEGFKAIIDTLGGVTLNVEKNMSLRSEGINLKKGEQRLDGDKALQYVRFRSDALGDIGRTERQQKFLKAIAREMLQVKTITKLPKLLPQISKAVQTNMSMTVMTKMANIAKDIDSNKLVSQTLPGNFANIKGGSYWVVDKAKVKSFIQEIMVSGITTDVIDETVKTTTSSSKTETKKSTKPSTQPVSEPKQPEVVKPTEPKKSSAGTGTGTGGTGTDTGTGTDAGTGGTGTGTGGTGTGTGGTGTGTGGTGTGGTGTGTGGTGTGTGGTDTGTGGAGTDTDTGGTGTDSGTGGTGTDSGTGGIGTDTGTGTN